MLLVTWLRPARGLGLSAGRGGSKVFGHILCMAPARGGEAREAVPKLTALPTCLRLLPFRPGACWGSAPLSRPWVPCLAAAGGHGAGGGGATSTGAGAHSAVGVWAGPPRGFAGPGKVRAWWTTAAWPRGTADVSGRRRRSLRGEPAANAEANGALG